MMQLGRIPQPADSFEWNGLCFEVMEMDDKRVDKVQVSSVPARKPADPEKKPDQG
jgi:putative hemolysin